MLKQLFPILCLIVLVLSSSCQDRSKPGSDPFRMGLNGENKVQKDFNVIEKRKDIATVKTEKYLTLKHRQNILTSMTLYVL